METQLKKRKEKENKTLKKKLARRSCSIQNSKMILKRQLQDTIKFKGYRSDYLTFRKVVFHTIFIMSNDLQRYLSVCVGDLAFYCIINVLCA